LAGYDVYYESQSESNHLRFIDGMKKTTKLAGSTVFMVVIAIMDTAYFNSLRKFEIPSPCFMAYPDIGNISAWSNDFGTELSFSQFFVSLDSE